MTTVTSAGGVDVLNPLVDFDPLRASDEMTSTSFVASDEVTGFGGMRELLFELSVTAVSVVGVGATAQVLAFVQRKTPSGQWDDLLMIASAALLHGAAPAYYVGEYQRGLVALAAPAAVQDAQGSAAFAQRGDWVSDALRVKAKLVTTGTSPAVTWSLYPRGRP